MYTRPLWREAAPTELEREIERRQEKIRKLDVQRATLDAEIITLEVGSREHPTAAAAWRRVESMAVAS